MIGLCLSEFVIIHSYCVRNFVEWVCIENMNFLVLQIFNTIYIPICGLYIIPFRESDTFKANMRVTESRLLDWRQAATSYVLICEKEITMRLIVYSFAGKMLC